MKRDFWDLFQDAVDRFGLMLLLILIVFGTVTLIVRVA